jgi:hypothetical protein
MKSAVATACLLASIGSAQATHVKLTWGSVVTETALGCDAFTPVRAVDGYHYTSFGDCKGLSGTIPDKLSMGFGRIEGGPANATVEDLPTPDLRDTGNRDQGEKPASALIVGGRMYVWIRNYASDGTQARLKYSDDFARPGGGSHWTWAPLTLPRFGFPVFVQGAPGSYAYVVAHDNNSAYTPGDRFILMRLPLSQLGSATSPQYFCGTATAEAWCSSYASRKPIVTLAGKCFRSGVSYNAARGRYYWWQSNAEGTLPTSFRVSSAPKPWGPWTILYDPGSWDMAPGERGEFPVAWMSAHPIGQVGTMHLLFSGGDRLKVRKVTVGVGY